jgi:hypothetical protein
MRLLVHLWSLTSFLILLGTVLRLEPEVVLAKLVQALAEGHRASSTSSGLNVGLFKSCTINSYTEVYVSGSQP